MFIIHTNKLTTYIKVNYTLVQALRLCTGRTAHWGSRGIAILFHDHGTRRGWGVSIMPRPLFTPGKDPVPIVQEAGWAPEPVWTGAENLASIGIRFPDRAARSQLLYRLRYPGHTTYIYCVFVGLDNTYISIIFHIYRRHSYMFRCTCIIFRESYTYILLKLQKSVRFKTR